MVLLLGSALACDLEGLPDGPCLAAQLVDTQVIYAEGWFTGTAVAAPWEGPDVVPISLAACRDELAIETQSGWLIVGPQRQQWLAHPPVCDGRWGPEPEAQPATAVLGVPIPWFAGRAARGEGSNQRITGSVGVAAGTGIERSITLGGSFRAAAEVEQRTKIGWLGVGASTAPLLWIIRDDSVVSPAVQATASAAWGSPYLRTGPEISGGPWSLGASWRVLFTPFGTEQALHGVGARAGWLTAPSGGEPVGWAGLEYVATVGLRSGRGGWQRTARTARGAPPDRDQGPGICRRLAFGVGATLGTTERAIRWNAVGEEGAERDVSTSPMGTASCDFGGARAGLFGSVESAPWFRYPTTSEITSLPQLGSFSAGAHVGSNVLRAGPIATAGVWALGVGGRVAVTPITDRALRHHGLEARFTTLLLAAPTLQGALLYSVWFDPRRGDDRT